RAARAGGRGDRLRGAGAAGVQPAGRGATAGTAGDLAGAAPLGARGMTALLHVAFVFFKIGLLAFGGSTGVLPELERQVVQEQGWLTQQEFVDSFALGQLTPGPALVMVMLPGYRLAGIPGALVALLAIFLPSAIMASVVTARWEALRGSAWFPAIQRGLGAV